MAILGKYWKTYICGEENNATRAIYIGDTRGTNKFLYVIYNALP